MKKKDPWKELQKAVESLKKNIYETLFEPIIRFINKIFKGNK